MDGTPTLRMNEFVLASIASGKVDLGPTRVNASRLPGVEELVFELDDKVQKAINEVYRTFNANQSPFVIADFVLPTGT